jgi:hypothetical protein
MEEQSIRTPPPLEPPPIKLRDFANDRVCQGCGGLIRWWQRRLVHGDYRIHFGCPPPNTRWWHHSGGGE